jgi:hypothetical protein
MNGVSASSGDKRGAAPGRAPGAGPDEPDAQRVRRGRLMLIGLATLFLGPVVLAFVLRFGVGWSGPGGDVSEGELLDPIRTLPSLAGAPTLLPGRATDPEAPLRRYWNIVHVTGDGCGEVCETALADSAKVRFLLVKELDRVSRVLLSTGPAPDLERLAERYPDLIVLDLTGGGEAARETLDILAWDGTEGVLHVADPRSNVVLRYPADMERMGMFHDLKRLLKLSRIG